MFVLSLLTRTRQTQSCAFLHPDAENVCSRGRILLHVFLDTATEKFDSLASGRQFHFVHLLQ
jgi:hypothetical protein